MTHDQFRLDREQPEAECPVCNGRGYDKENVLSNCCGAQIPGHPDYDFCRECHDHCAPEECEQCDGSGLVSPAHRKELLTELKSEL